MTLVIFGHGGLDIRVVVGGQITVKPSKGGVLPIVSTDYNGKFEIPSVLSGLADVTVTGGQEKAYNGSMIPSTLSKTVQVNILAGQENVVTISNA